MIDLSKISHEPYDPRGTFVPLLLHEPQRFDNNSELIDHLFAAASHRGASDFSIMSESRIHVQINGRQYYGSLRSLHTSEVDMILSALWRSADAAGIIRQGRALDFAYEIGINRASRRRYRINATGISVNGADGFELSIRSLPLKTPTLDSVKLEDEIRDYLNPKSGLIAIVGGTGHGKSSTMAAITRSHLENRQNPRKIIDYQAPIEYTFRDVLENNLASPAFIAQSEIGEGRNFATFGKAIWASLRRAPQIINVGESRDYESMSGCLAASVQGHIVNTTTHAGSVAEALRRMVLEFPADEQASRAYDLITSLKVVVAQHLVPTPDYSGRFAIREFMIFTDAARDRFASAPFDNWTKVASDVFKDAKNDGRLIARSLPQSIDIKIRQGLLTEATAREHLGSAFYERRTDGLLGKMLG
ncbi:ATPase, T2SS/T4P/T4SS family [Brucella sp. NBRC 12950]|uniref:type IV pilus twitching motility protein PilT n=1 Tax=Brucella sp. NBRC 12950 TaxID=2994518 RepID=UPI0024A410D3|nr:ATPase, T2SS/T4P/T4SS family [Brucella sp. NBRC 12950]GLU29907.1 Dot/Icm secretion system ATPase DotB [Brucella sp. NBRC 12950]